MHRRLSPLLIGLVAIVFFHGVVAYNTESPSYYERTIWDEGYYAYTAQFGYALQKGDYVSYSCLAFGPGYALLLGATVDVTGLSLPVARSVLSALLFLVGCFGLARLLAVFSSSQRRNDVVLAMVAFWPGSMYFLTGYAESLYFPLLTWCLYFLLRRDYLIASVLIAGCLFTRNTGIVLVPTLAVTMAMQAWKQRPRSPQSTVAAACYHWGRWLGWCGVCMVIAATGTLGYMAMLKHDVGDPWAFLKAYDAWAGVQEIGYEPWAGTTPILAVWLYPGLVSIQLAVLFFLAIPLLAVAWRGSVPKPLLIFVASAWLFFLHKQSQIRPMLDVLRWTATLVIVQLWVCLTLERAGRLCGPWRGRVIPALFGMTLVSYGVVYAELVSRYVRGLWVS